MSDPGYIYCIVKEVCVGGVWILVEANGLPLCKLGKSIHPPDRLAEAVGEASTWHPEKFRILFHKSVPSMKNAEDRLHAFFDETCITPAYPKGGVEWHLVNPKRVHHAFEALEGEDVQETTEDLVRPATVSRELDEDGKDTLVERFVADWDGAETSSPELYEKYRTWSAENNETPLPNSISFGRRLQSFVTNGVIVSQRKGGNTNYYWKSISTDQRISIPTQI